MGLYANVHSRRAVTVQAGSAPPVSEHDAICVLLHHFHWACSHVPSTLNQACLCKNKILPCPAHKIIYKGHAKWRMQKLFEAVWKWRQVAIKIVVISRNVKCMLYEFIRDSIWLKRYMCSSLSLKKRMNIPYMCNTEIHVHQTSM